ncbi:hypothetical protein BEWA_025360 [Theileria equi strain WA]|uniref:Uncharacterized protein n=1 Tax=Theileria equi strain WA TaxID=1537102 RepID=L0AVQ3_THEEQ|nr:hypothetical protein BEWA_025360 [Theileria equi strain WA]AFZ79687.1 hypothetical protein BEWA_025360 [Theileria equi strain WA]|eukprot:XP_004829353.1 hypothetical protein BEWA_025360 [Theileria equi strain WA]
MTNEWLQLNLDSQCDNGQCECEKSPDIIANKRYNTPVNGFFKVIHTDKNQNTFRLYGELQDGSKIEDNGDIHAVKEVSIYYWNREPSKPILIEVKYGSGTHTYYARGAGSQWIEHDQLSKDGEKLEKELDDLVCQHYESVTLDLTRSNSEQYAQPANNKYCCPYHSSGYKVSVEEKKFSCAKHPEYSHIKAYNHSITGGTKIAAIIFHDGAGTRKNITLKHVPNLPNLWCQGIYALYCGGNDPVLIYVDSPGSLTAKGWYEPNPTGGDDQPWVMVSNGPDNSPDEIKNCSSEGWETLKEVLQKASGCEEFGKCFDPAPQPRTETREGDSHGTSQIFPWKETVFGGLATVVSGSLTGFGWWLYKRSKGDPWVRQI